MKQYAKNLSKMREIRNIIGNHSNQINLPQLIVVGDQSSGKSSLLSAITGIQFPIKTGMCTKRPIVIDCECEPNYTKTVYFDENEKKIKNIKKFLVTNNDVERISENAMHIKCKGKNQMNVTIVDLPGIIHNGEDQQKIQNINKSYIENPHSFILACKQVTQDEKTAQVFNFIKKEDAFSRMMKIHTKCDSSDSMDTIEFIHNIHNNDSDKEHMVIAFEQKKKTYDEHFEKKRFEKFNIKIGKNVGIKTLKVKLPKIYNNIIRTNIKNLKHIISERIKETETKIQNSGGAQGRKPREIIELIHEQLNIDMFYSKIFEQYISLDTYNNTICDAFKKSNYDNLYRFATENKYSNMNIELFNSFKSFESTDNLDHSSNLNFQGYKQYMKHLSDISDKWIKTIKCVIQTVCNAYTDKISNIKHIPYVDANVSDKIKNKINDFLHDTFKEISDDILKRIQQYKCDSKNNPHYEVSKSETVKKLDEMISICNNMFLESGCSYTTHHRKSFEKLEDILQNMRNSMYNTKMIDKFRKKINDNVKEYFIIKIKELNGDFASIMKQNLSINFKKFVDGIRDEIDLKEKSEVVIKRQEWSEYIHKLKECYKTLNNMK